MYFHNYYKNPAFYDIYDYNWNQNDPGQLPDLRWIDVECGADTDCNDCGCPDGYSCRGEEEDYRPGWCFNPNADIGHNSIVFPQGWSTDERSLMPHGADRSPPWHQINVRPRRYNNLITSIHRDLGWEHIPEIDPVGDFGTIDFEKGTDLINSYNSGVPTAAVLSDRHLFGCKHFIDSSGIPDFFVFMNPSGTMYKVSTKQISEMQNAQGEIGTFQIFNDVSLNDTIIMEIDTIEQVTVSEDGRELFSTGQFFNTMTETGCPPISKAIERSYNIELNQQIDIPISVGPETNGRCMLGISLKATNQIEGVFKTVFSIQTPNIFPEYTSLHPGDSGTAGWLNTKSGYIFIALFAGGGRIGDPNFVEFVRENFIADYEIELVRAIRGSQYEIIDFFEHPDIEYSQSSVGGEDEDTDTVIPLTPDSSITVKSESILDEDENEIPYEVESNEIKTVNNKMLFEPSESDISTIFSVNGNQSENPTFYGNGVDDAFFTYTYTNDEITERSDFKMPSWENLDYGDNWAFILNGESTEPHLKILALSDTNFPKLKENTYIPPTSVNFNYTNTLPALGTYITKENFPDLEIGVEYPLQVTYTNTKVEPTEQQTYNLGNVVLPVLPEDIEIQYDTRDIFPGGQFTINLVSSNTPIPSISFQPEDPFGLVYFPESNINPATEDAITLVSHTDTSLTFDVIGETGELIIMQVGVFINYDGGRTSTYENFVFAETIQTDDLVVDLIVDPDIDSDGFADTYTDTLRISRGTDEGHEIVNYEWTVKFEDIVE